MRYQMAISYGDLEFGLRDRVLVISWPARNLDCFCGLNDKRDRVEVTWMPGFDTRQTRNLAGMMKRAGNRYLDELKLRRSPP